MAELKPAGNASVVMIHFPYNCTNISSEDAAFILESYAEVGQCGVKSSDSGQHCAFKGNLKS